VYIAQYRNRFIKNANAAVNILGLEEIHAFLASAFSEYITENHDEREILTFGIKAGVAAAELSVWTGDITRSEAYLAALSQNIGAIFLMRLNRRGYKEIFFKQLSHPFSAYDKEMQLMGTSHAYTSMIVAKRWNMAPEIYQAILLHHDEQFLVKTTNHPKTRKLVALMMLANYIVTAELGETFITNELKTMREMALTVLTLPENAIKAASTAVLKWDEANKKQRG
jgi:HD-like signal output (HDOD) protein